MEKGILAAIKARYQDFIAIGTSPKYSTSENKKIILVNNLIVASYLNCYLFAAFYWIGNFVGFAAFAIYYAGMMLATFLLKRDKIAPAKAVLPLAGSVAGLLINLSFPEGTNFELYNYTVLVEPFMIFTLKEFRYLTATTLATFLIYSLIFIAFKFDISYGYVYDPTFVSVLTYLLFFASTVTFIFVIFILFYNNEIAEITISEKNAEISNLLNNLKQGIFTLGPDLKIMPGYSAYTLDVLSMPSLKGISLSSLLVKANLSQDSISQIESTLNSCFGAPDLQFEVNSHLLPYEVNYDNKVLKLFWNTIIDENKNISSLMVSAIDITHEVELKREAQEKSEKLLKMGRILAREKGSVLAFIESSRKYTDEIKTILESSVITEAEIAQIFRNIHTIKGNSRVYDFVELVDLCHSAETDLKTAGTLNKGGQNSHIHALSEKMKEIAGIVLEYDNLFKLVYSGSEQDSEVAKIADDLEKKYFDSEELGRRTQMLGWFIERYLDLTSKSLECILVDQIAATKKVAKELMIVEPKIWIKDNSLRIRKRFHSALQDILTHALRNSVDHGLRHDLSGSGEIFIESKLVDSDVQITISDSGPGLNLKKIAEKAKRLDPKIKPEKMSDLEISRLVFLPNLSTKDAVTEISGRGVGMDFVKSMVEEMAGKVDIELLSSGANSDVRKFRLLFSFPKYLIR